jgi:hypothetical protein
VCSRAHLDTMVVYTMQVQAHHRALGRVHAHALTTGLAPLADLRSARHATLLPGLCEAGEGDQGRAQADVWLPVLPQAAGGEDVAQEVRAAAPYVSRVSLALPMLIKTQMPRSRRGGGFYACSTSTYKLHYFESASGLRFVMTTDLAVADMRENLRHIYSQIYVEFVTKNPMWRPGEPITNPLFEKNIERYVGALS